MRPRVGVRHALDVAARAGIAVPEPRPADAARLVDHEHREADLAQPVQEVQPGDAGTDDDRVVALAGAGLQSGPSHRPRGGTAWPSQSSPGARGASGERASSAWRATASRSCPSIAVPPVEPQPGTHVTADLLDVEADDRRRARAPARASTCSSTAPASSSRGPFGEVGLADWERVVGVNARAPFFLLQGLVDRMPPGSAVVGIASIEAVTVLAMSGATSSVYASTKAALRSLTETLAVELGPRGIRVNAVAPGLIRTPLTATGAGRRARRLDPVAHAARALGRARGHRRRRRLPGLARLPLHDRHDARRRRRHQPRADPRLGRRRLREPARSAEPASAIASPATSKMLVQAEVAVDHAGVAAEGHGDAGRGEQVAVAPRPAGAAGRTRRPGWRPAAGPRVAEQRRDARVARVGGRGEVVLLVPEHLVAVEEVALVGHVEAAREIGRRDRVDEQLEAHDRLARVAQVLADDGREVAAGRVAGDREAARVGAEQRRVRVRPARRGERIVGGGREARLGCAAGSRR